MRFDSSIITVKQSSIVSQIQTVRECFLHAFKDLLVGVLSSGVDREWQRRRRFHSEDALDSLRLKNSRAGYLSKNNQVVPRN